MYQHDFYTYSSTMNVNKQKNRDRERKNEGQRPCSTCDSLHILYRDGWDQCRKGSKTEHSR